jgi:hypothetical protein
LRKPEAGGGVLHPGERRPEISLDVDSERLERRDVDDAATPLPVVWSWAGREPVERPQKCRQCLAGAGRGHDEGVLTLADRRPRPELRRGGRREGSLEPRARGGGELVRRE